MSKDHLACKLPASVLRLTKVTRGGGPCIRTPRSSSLDDDDDDDGLSNARLDLLAHYVHEKFRDPLAAALAPTASKISFSGVPSSLVVPRYGSDDKVGRQPVISIISSFLSVVSCDSCESCLIISQ